VTGLAWLGVFAVAVSAAAVCVWEAVRGWLERRRAFLDALLELPVPHVLPPDNDIDDELRALLAGDWETDR
jgi:hypothetical protein